MNLIINPTNSECELANVEGIGYASRTLWSDSHFMVVRLQRYSFRVKML